MPRVLTSTASWQSVTASDSWFVVESRSLAPLDREDRPGTRSWPVFQYDGRLSVGLLVVRFGGMHCSLRTDSIHKALSRVEGVRTVRVSLAHEEALEGLEKVMTLGHSRRGNRTALFLPQSLASPERSSGASASGRLPSSSSVGSAHLTSGVFDQ